MTTMQKFVAILFGVSLLLTPNFVFAQTARSYNYDAIVQTYTVNKDSTVDVTEAQTYNYIGAYHLGWRSISLTGVGSIDNITVSDGATGDVFAYSSARLDKTNPGSWGKYTYYSENGHENIEWYYNLADTTHTFVLGYRLHGAIGFFDDHDELYWNLATEYDVPIKHINATVVLPEAVGNLHGYFYRNSSTAVPVSTQDNRTIFFSAEQIAPREAITIAAAWTKGVIPVSSYYKDTLLGLWGWLLGIISIIVGIFWAYYIQVIAVRRLGKGTIVPEYQPPQNLPPAEAEYVIKERLTSKAWPATVIDLSVRGYITITEEKKFSWRLVFGFVLQLVIFLIVLFSFASILLQLIGHPLASPVSFVLVTAVLLSMFFKLFKKGKLNELYTETDYQLRRTEKPTTDLKPYETDFLSALFKLQVASSAALESVRDNGSEKSPLSREVFSTLLMQQDPTASRALYMRMQEIEKNLYGEVEQETDAFSRGRAKWAKASFISIFLVIAGIQFGAGTITLLTSSQPGVLVLCLIVTAVIVTIAWFSPRLNQKGELLKEEWLGFKMYLETAERYRMQNLTPDTFEKYLPYAMIFGIEKKWAKAFEGMTMTPPTWYSSGTAVGVGVYAGTVSSPSFSPSSFASGFSTSFASSFASSGGSGSSGGGGGGGGGSGGGGGGGGGGGAG